MNRSLTSTKVWTVGTWSTLGLYDCLGSINPLNTELNPICHLLALLGARHILHISRIRVKVVICFWNTDYRWSDSFVLGRTITSYLFNNQTPQDHCEDQGQPLDMNLNHLMYVT